MRMKKWNGIMISVLLISAILIVYIDRSNIEAKNIDVPMDHSTIQEAIDNATEGDTILIANGTYYEDLIVNKTLSIKGNSTSGVRIMGSGEGPVITIISSWVNLTGVTVTGAATDPGDDGILIDEVDHCIISDVRINGSNIGINLEDADHCSIINCSLVDNNIGIYSSNGDDNEYGYLSLKNNPSNGIQLANGGSNGRNWIHNCTLVKNAGGAVETAGIFLWGGSTKGNLIENNRFYNNYNSISCRASGITGNVIRSNYLINSTNQGIRYTHNAGPNIFYNNAFVNNSVDLFGTTSSDTWDNGYPDGGNYWDSYSGVDLYHGVMQNIAGSDGRGELSISVEGGGIDRYPLMTTDGSHLSTYSVGSGTLMDPYQIRNVTELQWMGNISNLNKHFVITNDIEAGDTLNWNAGEGFYPVGDLPNQFLGSLDGQGFGIKNFSIDRPNSDYIGLFGNIGQRGSVSNLSLWNISIEGRESVGGLIGASDQFTKFTNISITGDLQVGIHGGGIIGVTLNSIIEECKTDIEITGGGYLGGIIGYSLGNWVTNCTSEGDVDGGSFVGGLMGDSTHEGRYTRCTSYGDVNGTSYVGGFAGSNQAARIDNCSSMGNVTGKGVVSGFSTNLAGGQIFDSFCTGEVNASEGAASGFCAENMGDKIIRCYSTGSVKGVRHVSGFTNGNIGLIMQCFSTGSVTGIPSGDSEDHIGGFASANGGRIVNCYSKGDVDNSLLQSSHYAGGFVGANHYSISECYSTGELHQFIWELYTNGFAGLGGGDIERCYFDMETANIRIGGGAHEKTTMEMMELATFKHWDFNVSWGIHEANTYPYLRSLENPDPPQADLEIEIIHNRSFLNLGDELNYTISATNHGPNNSAFVSARIHLSSEGIIISNDLNISNDDNDIVWNIGTLNSSDRVELNITASVLSTGNGSMNCTASLEALTHDPILHPNTTYKKIGLNRKPISSNDSYETDEDTPLNIQEPGLLENDVDPDEDGLRVQDHDTITTLGIELVVNPEGGFHYDPSEMDIFQELGPGEFLVDGFLYHISDGRGRESVARVNITITGLNDDPITFDDHYSISEDSILLDDSPGILSNDRDIDKEDHLSILSYGEISTYGAIVVIGENGELSYDPKNSTILQSLPVGSYLVDHVNYTVLDDNGGRSNSTVFINVTGTNDGPDAIDDYVSLTLSDGPTLIDILGNDRDKDGDELFVIEISEVDQGAASISNNGKEILYDLDPHFIGEVEFSYTVSDGNGGSDNATVVIDISSSGPQLRIITDDVTEVLEDQRYSVQYEFEHVLVGRNVRWSLDTDADWLTLDEQNGSLTGIPENSDVGIWWVNISATDGEDGMDHHNFTLKVINTNDDPTIITRPLDEIGVNQELKIQFEAEDVDPTSDTLHWSIITEAEWLSISETTGILTGTPLVEDAGTYEINITVTDGEGGIDSIVFTLTVIAGEGEDTKDNESNPMLLIAIIVLILAMIAVLILILRRRDVEESDQEGSYRSEYEE